MTERNVPQEIVIAYINEETPPPFETMNAFFIFANQSGLNGVKLTNFRFKRLGDEHDPLNRKHAITCYKWISEAEKENVKAEYERAVREELGLE